MGKGKTCAAIHMMDTDESMKFIFVTPYLNEVNRVVVACQHNRFFEPDAEEGGSKIRDLNTLLSAGYNVATTHKLFTFFDDTTYRLLKEGNYTLVIDEAMVALSIEKIPNRTMEALIAVGNVVEDGDGHYSWQGKHYQDDENAGMARVDNLLRNGTLERTNGKSSEYLWALNSDAFDYFRDVYILTYLFEYQPLCYWMKANDVDYATIGVKGHGGGTYRFCSAAESDKSLMGINELVHIINTRHMNCIGDDKHALSSNWYKKQQTIADAKDIVTPAGGLLELRRRIKSIYTHMLPNGKRQILWTCWKTHEPYLRFLKGGGAKYASTNCRGTNDYRDIHCGAYLVNVYMNPKLASWISRRGMKPDDDGYALSEMVQWVWRTAIRNDEDVLLYIPSMRMRHLLMKWLDDVSGGKRVFDEMIEKDLERLHENDEKEPGIRMRKKSRN